MRGAQAMTKTKARRRAKTRLTVFLILAGLLVLFCYVVYVLVNLLTDIAYHWVDPRVRPE